jgi:hypothetical protein
VKLEVAMLEEFIGELGDASADGSCLKDDPYEVAKAKGLKVVLPYANQLFIDIDDEDRLNAVDTTLGWLADNGVSVLDVKRTPSRKPGHYHVVVELDREVTEGERIALQAIMGSDPKRELLSLLRIWFKTDRPPTVFFEEAA